uniref:Profilin n=1 Tax=Hirudo medicinalis TaxID=6421 RepID=B3V3X2_HIRME|nr:putative profilin [Hirudo medicinalis]
MSWDSYRDNLTQSGSVDKAAICGLDDGAVWTQSAGFNLAPTEVKVLTAAFQDPSNIRASGINLGGTKYFCLQTDDCQIQGRKGSSGVSVAKSGRCVIIGTYIDGQQAGNCRKEVETIRDYLRNRGY